MNRSLPKSSSDSDLSDYDVPLINLKHRNSQSNQQQRTNKSQHNGHVIGLRAIIHGELINGPFVMFRCHQPDHYIDTISIYNEYFVTNKFHHVDILKMERVFVIEKHTILMILMNQRTFKAIMDQNADISVSLNCGESHVLEFAVDDEYNPDSLFIYLESLSIPCNKMNVFRASRDEGICARLYPDCFYISREDMTSNLLSDPQIRNRIEITHEKLETNVLSAFECSHLFIFPFENNPGIETADVLKGLKHIPCQHSMISRGYKNTNSMRWYVEGQMLNRLLNEEMLDDRIIGFWFCW